jgi:hypothetical protein
MTDQAVRHAAEALLKHYSFDLGGYSTDQLVQHWLDHYPALWLRMAIVEALYQGRYKAVSVDQILTLWHRRSQPVCHYNHEFERMICNRFPRNLLKDEEEQGVLMLADTLGAERFGAVVGPNSEEGASEASDLVTQAESLPQREPEDAAALGAIATDPEPTTAIEPETAAPPTFEPATVTESSAVERPISRDDVIRQPIHQFVPSGETPQFYARMRASSFADDDFFGGAEGN